MTSRTEQTGDLWAPHKLLIRVCAGSTPVSDDRQLARDATAVGTDHAAYDFELFRPIGDLPRRLV
jgi:hypothetical protein